MELACICVSIKQSKVTNKQKIFQQSSIYENVSWIVSSKPVNYFSLEIKRDQMIIELLIRSDIRRPSLLFAEVVFFVFHWEMEHLTN